MSSLVQGVNADTELLLKPKQGGSKFMVNMPSCIALPSDVFNARLCHLLAYRASCFRRNHQLVAVGNHRALCPHPAHIFATINYAPSEQTSMGRKYTER